MMPCPANLMGYLLPTLCTLCLLLTCCEKNGSSGPSITVVESASGDISASLGGYISTESGVSLYIPPMALSADTRITVEKLLVTSDMPKEYLAIVRCSPAGLELELEATLTIPVEDEAIATWQEKSTAGTSQDEFDVLSFLTDPGYAIHDDYIFLSSGFTSGEHQAVISTGKCLGGKIVSVNCHAGTMKRILTNFKDRGCLTEEFISQINAEVSGAEITEKTLENASADEIKALLNTYFDEHSSYLKGKDITPDEITKLKEFAQAGRKVVFMFGPNSGGECIHTAVLEFVDGKAIVRNTCNVGKRIIEAIKQSNLNTPTGPYLSEEVIYDHDLDDINTFRTTRPEIGVELALCGSPGCLGQTDNLFHVALYPPLDKRTVTAIPWAGMKVYVEKSEISVSKADGDNGNPCATWEMGSMWCAWYIDNVSLNPVRVTTHADFEKEELCMYYPGGGMDPNLLMEKVMLTGQHNTKEEAISAACALFDEVYPLPGSSTFVWTTYLGWIGDERYDCDELGGCIDN